MNTSKAEASVSLTPTEVAALLGISRGQAYRWIHRSVDLIVQRRRRRIFIDGKDFESVVSKERASAPRLDTKQEKGAERPQAPTLPGDTKEAVPVIDPSRPVGELQDGGGGQRELRLPQRTNYPFAVFADFEFIG